MTSEASVGILCEQQTADEWLFPLLNTFSNSDIKVLYILIIAKSTNKALARKILEFPGIDKKLEVNFCMQSEFSKNSNSIQLPSSPDLFINITPFKNPSWAASKTKYGILQLDFHRNNLQSLYSPMIRSYLPTVVHTFLMQPSGMEYIIHSMQYRTIDHSIKRQVNMIKSFTYMSLPGMIKEVKQNLFRCWVKLTNENLNDYPAPSLFYLRIHSMYRFLKKQYSNLLFYNKWNVGVVPMPISAYLEEPSSIQADWLPEPQGRDFNADPFAFEEDTGIRILYEKFNGITNTGSIESVIYNNGYSSPEHVINGTAHYSYPFVFRFNDEVFMVPESSAKSAVDLYKKFPEGWKRYKTVIEGMKAVDPTVFEWRGRWWLFCTDKEHKGSDLRLYIFHATHPEGPWTPHLLNPVKTSICSARPAGTPFIRNGCLFRPSQDSSRSYGRSIIINEVITLTESAFEERQVACIQPWQFTGKRFTGVHTIASCGPVTLVDARTTVFSISNLLRLIRKR